MLFDKLCKIAEREHSHLADILRTIKLFHFPGKPHEFLPKVVDDEIVDFLRTQFMLPFQRVAIEDDAGLVILEDLKKNSKGIDNERDFIDVVRLSSPHDVFRKDDYDPTMVDSLKETDMFSYDPLIITTGTIEGVNWFNNTNFITEGFLKSITIALIKPLNKKHIYRHYEGKLLDLLGKEMIDLHLRSATVNAMTALEEILYANTPNKFIVEISPVRDKNKKKVKFKKSNRILRSHERKTYILLTPNEIRKVIKEENNPTQSSHKSPKLHERRAHPRTFHSDKFVNMKGKTIMIPAVWIGTSEKIVGNRRYKVMLDI